MVYGLGHTQTNQTKEIKMSEPSLVKTDTCEQKHTALDRAIEHIDDVLHEINKIKRRISGEDRPDVTEKLKDPQNTTLLEILNGGSARINDKCSQIHKALSDLESSLF